MTPPTGLFEGQPAPSIAVLEAWLDAHGVYRHPGVRVADMADGSGWRLLAARDLNIGETICKIPKTALLSTRTSLAPPHELPSATHTSHTILALTLAVLHELRLGPDSRFWGYLQSLPREIVPVPVLWPLWPAGSDAREAEKWLRGTEAERDLGKRNAEGLGLAAMQQYYAATAPHLPSTRAHPGPSPFVAFAHAFSLVSTRAFVIDLFHTVALCPFADVLNHADGGVSHTSLASDDFVCHICGSLAACVHDAQFLGAPQRNHVGEWEDVPLRLEHLDTVARARIQRELDTVDMYVEKPVRRGREVMNSYGDGIGPARLLVEWGFVPGATPSGQSEELDGSDADEDGFAGLGITWDMGELPPDATLAWDAVEAQVVARLREEDEDELLCKPASRDGVAHLNHAGQVSLRLFGVFLVQAVNDSAPGGVVTTSESKQGAMVDTIVDAIASLERAWTALSAEDDSETEAEAAPITLQPHISAAVRKVLELLERRIQGLHRPDLSVGAVYDLREALTPADRLQTMAMTIVIDELALLRSTVERWSALLEG